MSTSSASSATPGIYSSDMVPDGSSDDAAAPKNGRENAESPQHPEPAGEVGEVQSGELEQPEFGVPPYPRLPVARGPLDVAATSSVSAEAQQGDGPAAAGASASGVGRGIARTSVVSVVIGPDGAAAACEAGAVVAGPHGAAAASQAGVAAVGQNGAASSSNAANATSAAVDGAGENGSHGDLLARLARLEEESRELRSQLQ
jgi:hypothetical protein